MKNIKQILKKCVMILATLILNFLTILNCTYASNIDNAQVYAIGDCGELLKYKGIIVKANYVQYDDNNGNHYPAYCLDKTKSGAQGSGYQVSIQETMQDVQLWKIIINGYPYKTIEQLGCSNKEEAFTATKQAIYCYIHGNQIDDYTPLNEGGIRTLNAMKKILEDAQNSTENIISNTININKQDTQWKQDEIQKDYVSKTYSVKSNATIQSYVIRFSTENKQLIEGIKITDKNNEEKQEFNSDETFKVLIPIKYMRENGEFKLEVEGKVNTKPVFIGRASNPQNQDYALTASIYEDGQGEVKDTYYKNNTKIIIVKQDKETKEKLQNVEFELLNDNKEVIYSNLRTDSNGRIEVENLLPGNYYLKEINTKDGYIPYEELINIAIKLNQVVTITVNNTKEEIPEITINEKEVEVENEKTQIEISQKEIEIEQEIEKDTTVIKRMQKEKVKLPVTGM